MTARHYEETQIEEGQASLDAYEASIVPIEHAKIDESLADIEIDAAKVAIKLLFEHLVELDMGRETTCTLAEIGEGLLGDGEVKRLREIEVAYKRVAPNWREKHDLAKRQDKLLRDTARSLYAAINTMENDLYATRVANAMQHIEDAYNDLKDDYAPEG